MGWKESLLLACVISLYHGVNTMAIQGQRARITNECDGTPLPVSDKSGVLRPKANPTGKGYIKGNCTWELQAGEGELIEFTFTNINIYCGRRNRPNTRDFITIYDGISGAVLINSMCGRARPNSAALPPPFLSETNVATVTFVSNKRQNRRPGFKLKFKTVEPPSPGTDPCSPQGVLLNGESGEGQTNGFRTDDNGAYENNAECKWQISAPEDRDIVLTFDSFAVEQSRRCIYDALTIYDGDSDTAQPIGRYCGFEKPPTIKSSDSDLFLKFRTDYLDVENGFHFTYALGTPGIQNDGSFPGCAVGSDQQLSGSSGTLNSPMVASGNEYPSESDCGYVISVASGKQVKLTFNQFDVESGPNCTYDSVKIYNGPDSSHPYLVAPLCGDQNPEVPLSSGNQVYVVFSTDSTQQGAGFALSWEETFNSDPCSGSGVTYTSTSGSISSLVETTGGYGHNKRCTWRIKLDDGASKIALTWGTFDVEAATRCRYDSVEVFDGEDENAKSLGVFCSSALPPAIKSSGNSLTIRLTSDVDIDGAGFTLNYEVASPGVPDNGNSPACGGKTQELSGSTGTFSSPGFTGSSDYNSNADCSWQISVAVNSMVKLTFTNFNLEQSHECRADSVVVYPGTDTSANAAQVLCGQIDSAVQVMVMSNTAFVTFDTDSTVQRTGFQVAWEQLDAPTPPPPGSCGISNNIKPMDLTQTITRTYSDKSGIHRIVGGSDAYQNSIPWQAALLDGTFQFCGASILTPYWIVTAAHCTEGKGASQLRIRVGDHDRYTAEGPEQIVDVERKIEHPNYNSRTVNNDITLLKLKTPLDFNDNVQPICLRSQEVSASSYCLTTGWGSLTQGGPTARTLQQVYLPIVTEASCRQSYGTNAITTQMICAGATGIDACQGDSGGPLACQDGENGPWYLHGVTSWGNGCAQENFPGIWTRVTEFLDWIVQETGGDVSYS